MNNTKFSELRQREQKKIESENICINHSYSIQHVLMHHLSHYATYSTVYNINVVL